MAEAVRVRGQILGKGGVSLNQVLTCLSTHASRWAQPLLGFQIVRPWMQFGDDDNYYPLIYFNDFWLLRDKLVL
eukprot:scaffold84111_cov18-Tisochrysis_lutea.AAC.1